MQPEKIFIGVGAGITYGLSAYSKSKGEEFDWVKFSTTIVIGAGAGFISSVVEMPIESSYEYVIQIGAVTMIDNGIKALYRKIIIPIRNKFQI